MTITVSYMDATAGSPAYTAKQARQSLGPLLGGASGRTFGGHSGWRVGTPSSVIAVTSTAWTLSPSVAMIEPGAVQYQGMYAWGTDSSITGSITAADSTNPRVDIVYIQINDSSAGDGTGLLSGPVNYLAGSPASTPSAPTLPARSFLVATINVPKAGGGSPTVTLNPQYFVASGGILPVNSKADRDSLNLYPGLEVCRMDRNNHTQKYDGTAWKWVSPPERYYADPTTFDTTQNQISKVIGSVPAPTRSYATKVRVNGRLTVLAASISTGTLQLRVCVSVAQNQVVNAQARALLPFTSPGSYYDTRAAETDWIAVGPGAAPLARIWIDHVSGAVNEGAMATASDSHLWAEVLPADD